MKKKLADVDWKTTDHGYVEASSVNVEKIKDLLNETGCGFCLAKFRQVTLHLGSGLTHSCHHPSPHKIDPVKVVENPNLLFNTPKLKAARKQMLNGERPSECDYCWRVEENNGTSDRHFKSLEPWALPFHDEISEFTGDEDIYPSYLEVSFSNVCNMKCTYCGPDFSSKWVEELKHHGPVKLLEKTKNENWSHGWQNLDDIAYRNREFNPYIDAFWKWFPKASEHLKHYRITGGEPLMSKETFKSMDFLIDNPNPELEFSVNSNFSVPDKLWDKFIERLDKMKDGKVKKITVYTSIEGWGERAEYARTGLNFDLLLQRFEQILQLGNIRCVVMAAYNIFSVTSIKEMLVWIHQMKSKYNPNNAAVTWEKNTGFALTDGTYTARKERNPDHQTVVGIDLPYLRHPSFLDAQIVTHDLVEKYMIPTMSYLAQNASLTHWNSHQGFEEYEIEKFKRILIHRFYFNKRSDEKVRIDIDVERAKFYDFVNQMDQRRGTNFIKTFPEMEHFYDECRKSYEQYKAL